VTARPHSNKRLWQLFWRHSPAEDREYLHYVRQAINSKGQWLVRTEVRYADGNSVFSASIPISTEDGNALWEVRREFHKHRQFSPTMYPPGYELGFKKVEVPVDRT
jgi:hypothetical protein